MDSTVMTIISASGLALSGAIGVLWRNGEKRAEQDREKHEKTQNDLLLVTKEVGELKGRVHIVESIKPKLDNIENLAQETVDHLNNNDHE